MKLVILVAGPAQVGKKRLLEEIGRSPTAATAASEGSLGAASVTVKNKYFQQDVHFQSIPLSQLEESIESHEGWSGDGESDESVRSSTPSKIIGLIVLLPASRTPDSVDWCLFRTDFSVRMLMCREGYPPKKDGEPVASPDFSDQWYTACVAHSVEYVPYRWSAESFAPRPKIEWSGLLGEELTGSERVLQAIWNINFANLPTRTPTGSAQATPPSEATTKVFSETSSNTVLCLGIQTEPIVRLLERIFPAVAVEKDPANEPPSMGRETTTSGSKGARPLLLSGRRVTFDVQNKYFSLSAAARLLTPFYFTSSMIDILALGPRYKMLLLFIDSMFELPQLQQGVDKLRGLTEEIYVVALMDNLPVLVKQWSEHHATELIQILSTDDGTRFDREEGALGLRRLKELFDVCQWDMQEARMSPKASGSPSGDSQLAAREKPKKSLAETAKETWQKLTTANPNLMILFSIAVQPDAVYTALQDSGLDKRFTGLIRRDFLLGATEPTPTTETMLLETKYYKATVKCIHISLRTAEEVTAWVPAFLGAPVVLCAADSGSSLADHSRIRKLVVPLLLQRIPEPNEDNLDVVDEKVTALLTLGSEPNEAFWPVPESESKYIETVVVAEDAQRFSELILSTVWPKSERTELSTGTQSFPLARPAAPSIGAIDSENSSSTTEKSSSGEQKSIKRFGCELPPGFFVHPQTLISSRFPDEATAEMISARVKLVKDFGSRLSPTERSRQAEYFATRMAEHVIEE